MTVTLPRTYDTHDAAQGFLGVGQVFEHEADERMIEAGLLEGKVKQVGLGEADVESGLSRGR